MIFSLEISDELDSEVAQFTNLKKFRNKLIDIIAESFRFTNTVMSLIRMICMSKVNQYSAYCHRCLTDRLNLNKTKSYYYD